jgi:hypothetical protein
MSWSDDMRCLYCDGKLPLYRKITHGQFCSATHRKAYWQEQERLAVERLTQTHNSIKAYRPPVAVESILGRDPGEVELSGFVAAVLYPQSQGAPRMLVADPLAYDLERIPGKLEWILPECAIRPEIPVRSVPSAGLIRQLQEWSNQAIFGKGIAGSGAASPRGVEPVPKIAALAAARPRLHLSPLSWTEEVATAGRVEIVLSAIAPASRTISPQPFASRMPHPAQRLDLPIAPATPELEPRPAPGVETQLPVADSLFQLRRLQAREFPLAVEALGRAIAAESLAPASPLARFPERRVVKAVGLPGLAGPLPLRLQAAQPVHAALAGNVRALAPAVKPAPVQVALTLPVPQPSLAMGKGSRYPIRLRASAAPVHAALAGNVRPLAPAVKPAPVQLALVLPVRQPTLAMGKGSRYPIRLRASAAPRPEAQPMDFPRLPADVPPIPLTALAPAASLLDAVVPETRGLVSLNVKFGPPPTQAVAPIVSNVATIPQPLRTEPIRPSSRLEPLDAKPFADLMQPGAGGAQEPGTQVGKAYPWNRAAGFWKLAPRDLKLLAFAIPALLALTFHRELPKIRVHYAATPPSTGAFRKNLQTVVNTQWTNLRQAVTDRAAVALEEDFRSGLDDWASRSDATADWSFDSAGFVRPGPLALYRPSMNLTNYQVQFLGMIDKKALSWVVRAADFDNYYVLKLVVLKSGPRTTVGLTRYAVIHGKAVDRVDTVVPMEAQPDTLYRVRLELDGDDFSLGIQGHMVDNWSEPRLPRGGIGFFTSPGEGSRIRWVALTHQYDMLGRLCAYLAPYETPTTNGSW